MLGKGATAVSVEFSIVRLGNQIEYFFGTAAPGFLSWFGENWYKVFQDAANIVATAASNIWNNMKNLWDAIVYLFEGNGFNFKAVGLLDGYKSALTEMPKIAARVAGGTETALGQEMTDISANLNKNFSSFIDDRTKQQAEATQKLHDATHGLFDKLKHPNFPTMPKLAVAGERIARQSAIGRRRTRQSRRARQR